eukprot:Phypoly_transcript_08483.p1 GENE.Phypoly_transcript_08483~~Phypoly_transcript_08483.p1  ORF type:complete len:208 (-),score=27.05 Phypoly_transcript_08483:886-1434(-)
MELSAESLTEQDVDLLYGLFRSSDSNDDGKLDLSDFISLARGNYPQPEELFNIFDHNGDGLLDFQEFTAAIIFVTQGTAHQKLEWLFNIYDIERNGVLSFCEIISLLQLIQSSAKRIFELEDESTNVSQQILEKLQYQKEKEDTKSDVALNQWLSASLSTPAILSLIEGTCDVNNRHDAGTS